MTLMRAFIPALALALCAVSPLRTGAAEPAASAGILHGMRVAVGPVVVDPLLEDLSGISFNPETGSLFAIRNKSPRVFELDHDGKVLRSLPLDGEDTEDLVCLGGGRLAIIEERRRTLSIYTLPDAASPLAAPETTWLIEPQEYKNVGLEGVAYDAATGRFFVVKEKEPRRLYTLANTAAGATPSAVTIPWDLETRNFGLADVSAVAFVPENGHLLILSDESRAVVECTTDGVEIDRLPLTAGSAGLASDVIQPEGITLDDHGHLFVVCEPNLFYRFSKP